MAVVEGIRLSVVDAVAIAGCAVLVWLVWPVVGQLALAMPITLGHFFLFCNVFRVRRSFELLWAAVLLVNVACWSFLAGLSWIGVLVVQTPITIALIALERSSHRRAAR